MEENPRIERDWRREGSGKHISSATKAAVGVGAAGVALGLLGHHTYQKYKKNPQIESESWRFQGKNASPWATNSYNQDSTNLFWNDISQRMEAQKETTLDNILRSFWIGMNRIQFAPLDPGYTTTTM